MKKIQTLLVLLALMPFTTIAQNWESVPIQYPGIQDSLKMRQDVEGRLCFVINKAFLRNISSPAEFKALREDGEETTFVAGDIDLSLGEQLNLNLPLVRTSIGLCYRLNIHSPMLDKNLYVEYYPHKLTQKNDSVMAVSTYEELVIHDYRTKEFKNLQGQEKPEFGFDVVDFDHDGRFGHPNYVYSIDPNGRSHVRRVNPFHVGIYTGPDKGLVYNAAVQITPYSVENGKKVYHFTMVMSNGNKVHQKLEVLTDTVPSM